MSTDFYTPTAIANESLSAAGSNLMLGDLQEGTDIANTCLRKYLPCVQQMLRCAGWDFARKESELLLLADATGNTPNVGTVVPGSQFLYSYAFPQDSAFVRYIPWNPFITPGVPQDNIQPPDPSAPLMTGINNAVRGQRVVPARWMLTSDQNNIPAGTGNDQPGVSPLGRSVILTNVRCAKAVYTYNAVYPNVWDSQFRAAVVAYLAAEIALPISSDKKFGMAMRAQNIAIAQDKIKNARVSDGKEGWHDSGLQVDWMRFRNSGGGGPWGGSSWWSGVGDWGCTYDSIGGGTSNSSAY